MGRAVVIGAGIGGLTAGLALAAQGWQVEVIERAPALRPVGFALLIAPNAQNALAALPGGIVDELHALSCISGDGGLRDARGRWLSRDNAALAQQRYGHPMVLVRRAALVEMLASRLPAGALRLDAAATAVDAEAGTVALASGEVLTGDLVVAADGIHSVTRSTLWPAHPGPVYSGYAGWQTVIPSEGLAAELGMIWAGGELGTLTLTDAELYVFANAAVPARPPRPGEAELGELTARFGRLPAPVPELLARIDPETLLRTDIHTLAEPLPAYHSGRVAVLGDAAHAMTPNLGQGACQAIEDAVTLAHHIGARGVAAGLPAYSADRLPRTVEIAHRAALIARLATLRNPVLQAIRNAALWAVGRMGTSVVRRQADFVMRWRPPAGEGSG